MVIVMQTKLCLLLMLSGNQKDMACNKQWWDCIFPVMSNSKISIM